MANTEKTATEQVADILIKKANQYGLVARKRKYQDEFGDIRVMVSQSSLMLSARSDRGEDFLYCLNMDLPEEKREEQIWFFYMFFTDCKRLIEQEGGQ